VPVWVGIGRAVYIGPSLRLSTHSGAVACLALGVDAPLRVHVGPGEPVVARSVLVPARLPHRMVTDGVLSAFCYLDPTSGRHESCRARMVPDEAGLHLAHADERALLDLARSGDAAALLACAAPAEPRPAPADPRIGRAVRRLETSTGVDTAATELAAEAGLSTSRFLHLFGEQTGTTVRRYRSWSRMVLAAGALATGADLTRAAADAGFATPSHFTAAFRRMFGLPPSRLLAHAGRPVGWTDRPAEQRREKDS
jgi:AraC-like DNA-binding protein